MPALVNSNVGSLAGTSDELRTMRWLLAAKKLRNVSRISFPVMYLYCDRCGREVSWTPGEQRGELCAPTRFLQIWQNEAKISACPMKPTADEIAEMATLLARALSAEGLKPRSNRIPASGRP